MTSVIINNVVDKELIVLIERLMQVQKQKHTQISVLEAGSRGLAWPSKGQFAGTGRPVFMGRAVRSHLGSWLLTPRSGKEKSSASISAHVSCSGQWRHSTSGTTRTVL